jgi:ribose 5-phosphate isomerase B
MKNAQVKPAAVHLATDHAAFALKEALREHLVKAGYKVDDMGAFSYDPKDDYTDFIIPAAEAVAAAKGRAVAIVMGGTGIGECIAANKVPGVRAALVTDVAAAKKTREHNDTNVLCLGGRTATKNIALAKRIVKAWLETPFSGDTRHKRRIRKISDYEKKIGSRLRDNEDSHHSHSGECVHDL